MDDSSRKANRIINALRNRKGFGDWWEDIYPADRKDIVREIAAIVERRSARSSDA